MEISRLLGSNAGNWSIKILALAAAVLLFFYNQIISLEQETFSVPLQIEIADELSPASSIPDSVRITVRGSEQAVQALSGDSLTARVDATRYSEPGRYTITVDASVKANDIDAQAVDLQVQPAAITLELDRQVRTWVKVNPTVQGFPARGYELSRSFVSPARVEIEGPERYITARRSISTEPVDLTARTESFDTEVRLRPPNEFIQVRGGSAVDFHGVVEEVQVETWFSDVEISVVNAPEELEFVGSPGAGAIHVRGPLLALEALRREELSLEADAGDVDDPGEYDLEITPVVPDGIEVLDYEPRSVTGVFDNGVVADIVRLEGLFR